MGFGHADMNILPSPSFIYFTAAVNLTDLHIFSLILCLHILNDPQ